MRKFMPLLLVLLGSLLLSGCIKAVVRVNEDGSGTYELAFAMSLTQLQQMDETSGEPPDPDTQFMVDLMNAPVTDQESGITISAEERIENAQRWTYIVAQVPDLDSWQELEGAFTRVFPQDEGEDESSDLVADDDLPRPLVTLDGGNIRVEMTQPAAASQEEMDEMTAALQAFFTMAVEIDLAGELVEHNGQIDSLTGNPVWFLDQASAEPLNIYAVSKVE